jgi:hypothetical protein
VKKIRAKKIKKNLSVFNPDISRVRDVHLQGIQGRSPAIQSGIDLRRLLQDLDKAANGRLAHARRVKIFEELNKKNFMNYSG